MKKFKYICEVGGVIRVGPHVGICSKSICSTNGCGAHGNTKCKHKIQVPVDRAVTKR